MTPSRRRRRTIYQDRLRADHPGDYRAFIPKEGLPFFHRTGLDDQKQLRWFSPFFGDSSPIKKVISANPKAARCKFQVRVTLHPVNGSMQIKEQTGLLIRVTLLNHDAVRFSHSINGFRDSG